MIKQPDQAQGFTQDTQRGVVVPILGKLIIRTVCVLTEKDAIRQLHLFPLPPARVAGLTWGKEAPYLDHLPAAALHLAGQHIQKLP